MSELSNLHQLKEQMSLLAEQIAEQGFGITLDYSIESIKQVEQILATVHKEYKKTRSEDGLQGIAFEFGAYIVKVIENNFGPAEWQRNHKSVGENTFPLQWRDATLFPVEWCKKRIFDGSEDDVWIKFKIFVLDTMQEDIKNNSH
ncbi:MAG: hypothetical protein M3Q99_12205 [Acidobacteriota bacterium]|nr:hypothetical protein [Acidobacteriota bacterium]